MRVLVVEDNELVREVAVAALRDAGFDVSEAASGEELVAEPTASKQPEVSEQGAAADLDGGHLHLEPDDPVRVLVVENNEPVREPIVEGLRQAGFRVSEAANGEEATGHCGQSFDVLFTDIDLPGGMDGWRIAEHWRERDPTIGVIYTSGFCLGHARQVSGSRCVPKPYRPGQIVAAVVEVANEVASERARASTVTL